MNAAFYAICTANSTYIAARIGETESFHVQGPVDSFTMHGLPRIGISFEYNGHYSRKRTSPVRSIKPLSRKQWQEA